MSRALTLAVLAVVSIVTFGCGAREAQQAALNAPTADVNGTWSGSAGTGGQSVPVTMNLTQSGTAVNGQISVGGRPDLSGAVKGTVQGQIVKLALERVTLGQMIVRDNTMSGEVSGGLPATLRRSREARAGGAHSRRLVTEYRPRRTDADMPGSLRMALVALAALALVVCRGAPAPADEPLRRVLVLLSERRELPGNIVFEESLRAVPGGQNGEEGREGGYAENGRSVNWAFVASTLRSLAPANTSSRSITSITPRATA